MLTSPGSGSISGAPSAGASTSQPSPLGQRTRAGPDDLARRGQLVEQGGGEAGYPPGQDERLQCGRGHRRAGQPLHHLQDRPGVGPPPPAAAGTGTRPAVSRGREPADPVPGGQEPGQYLRRDRLRLLAQPGQAAAAQQAQHLRVAPLGPARRRAGRQELALDHAAAGREPPQRHRHHGGAQRVPPGHRGRGERAVRPRVPGHQVAQWVGDRLGERLGHAHRQRNPRASRSRAFLDRGPHGLPRDRTWTARRAVARSASHESEAAPSTHREATSAAVSGPGCAQQVGDALQVPAAAALRQVLQVTLDLVDHGGIEQLA